MATTQLMLTMPPTGWAFTLNVADEVAGERGGQMRVRQLGPDLWTGRFSSNQMRPRETMARQLKAIVGEILARRSTFYAWDPQGQFPKADPTGSKMTAPAANVQINSVNADFVRMSLKGLPANYVLTFGDYISFAYGSGARAFHMIVPPTSTVAADALGTGITPEFYVIPRIRVGYSVGAVVQVVRPFCEMMIVPGSLTTEETPHTAAIGFDAVQVLP